MVQAIKSSDGEYEIDVDVGQPKSYHSRGVVEEGKATYSVYNLNYLNFAYPNTSWLVPWINADINK